MHPECAHLPGRCAECGSQACLNCRSRIDPELEWEKTTNVLGDCTACAPEPRPHSSSIDIGATDARPNVELRLWVTHETTRFRVTVYADNSCAIDRRIGGNWMAEDMNTGYSRHVIGHVLRRAICRGIDTCEVTESDSGVDIDLKELKLPW